MNNSEVYVGLDIGTTSIKALVCESVKGQLKVIGVGVERSTGLNRGVIVDIDKTAQAISAAVAQAEEKSNVECCSWLTGKLLTNATSTWYDYDCNKRTIKRDC